jgi:multidrug efflux system membrane fusion protein
MIPLGAGIAAGCSKKEQSQGGQGAKGAPVPVNIGEVLKKEMPVDLRVFGSVEAISTVAIKAQVGGELMEVNFEEGQEVKKGDLLFTIQPKLYATQLAQAEANLARDRVTAANTQRDAERNIELAKKGAVSKEQLDQSRAQAEAVAASVKADEALVEIARVQLGYTTVESPIDGRTGALSVRPGNLIKAAADDAMVTIKQLAPIYVAFSVPEEHLADIRKGIAERKLAVTALDPKKNAPLADGNLTFISNAVDSETGTVVLKATFANDDRALWPGAYVDIILHLSTEPNATVAPASAVSIGQKGQQIFVVKEDGTVELRPVIVERTVGQEAVIQKGVQPGEKVVINGQSRLMPGSKIVITSAVAPNPGPDAPMAMKGGDR